MREEIYFKNYFKCWAWLCNSRDPSSPQAICLPGNWSLRLGTERRSSTPCLRNQLQDGEDWFICWLGTSRPWASNPLFILLMRASCRRGHQDLPQIARVRRAGWSRSLDPCENLRISHVKGRLRSLACWSFVSKALFSVSRRDSDFWAGRRWLFQGLLLSDVNRRCQIKVLFFTPYLSSSSEEAHRGQLWKPYWLAQFLKYHSWKCQQLVKPAWLQNCPHFQSTPPWTHTDFFHMHVCLGAGVLTSQLCWDSVVRSIKSRRNQWSRAVSGRCFSRSSSLSSTLGRANQTNPGMNHAFSSAAQTSPNAKQPGRSLLSTSSSSAWLQEH